MYAIKKNLWSICHKNKTKMKTNHFIYFIILILLIGCTNINEIEIQQRVLENKKFLSLNEAKPSEIINMGDKEIFNLEAKPVIKDINGIKLKMYAYNNQIPGPVIKVRQGSTISVNFTNNIDMDTTIHWHGIRLDNKYDGVPNVTQQPIKPDERFLYELYFPDEGIYWYHPHIREDLQQELGLYGNIIVEPRVENYYNKVDREVFLFLDDIKMAKNKVDVFGKDFARFALMGRFGNVMLTNGETDYSLSIKKGEVVRFYLADAANTRTFNFSIEEYKLKLIGSDSGKFEKEEFVDSIVIAPAERYIAEILFDKKGTFDILHKTPLRIYKLGTIEVSDEETESKNYINFLKIKENIEIKKGIDKFRKYFDKAPDYEIDLSVDMHGMGNMEHSMMDMDSEQNIEWEDDMPMMNAMATSKNTKWILKDRATGKENMDINYQVKVGDIKKIRIFNNPKSIHPMQHPMHLHGQRFLVLSVNGKQNDNLVWKDTVLVPKGSTADILVEFTNPGNWMFHCHIAEHLESGMMSMFNVI